MTNASAREQPTSCSYTPATIVTHVKYRCAGKIYYSPSIGELTTMDIIATYS